MPVHNSEIAEVFRRLADLLDLQDENPFRIRAYRNAARTVAGLPRSLGEMVHEQADLSKLPGIGKDLAGKIAEIVETGHLKLLDELQGGLPPGLPELMTIPRLGPKKVKALYDQLHIGSVRDLVQAAREEKIRALPGFGPKTEQQILEEIGYAEEAPPKRTKLADAEQFAEPLVEYLKQVAGVKQVVVAGSYRRRMETVGDLDILATCRKGSKVMDRFVEYDDVRDVLSKGTTRSTIRLRSGLQVDLRVVADVSYGAALHYFTGSKPHNIAIRQLAMRKKLKINEYGVFRGQKRVAGRTEEEVYKTVGLPYIEPELREVRGEIEAAREGKLPKLVTLDDIRGNLHTHTTDTDGRYSLQDMVEAARQLGYDYLAITDHSKAVTVAKGLDKKRLARQIKAIDRLNATLKGFRVLKGIEVDILENGALDLDEGILKELDVVVGSIHSRFKLSRKKQTERVLRAMDHPCFHILGHPTGRLINKRAAYEIDMEQVVKAARQRGCFLELNAQPERLDLSDGHCQMAKEAGVKIAISTDAHATSDLEFMRFGIDQARRGWLEPNDVLNTRSWTDLEKLLSRR